MLIFRGVSLSGGQKARVALARAIYAVCSVRSKGLTILTKAC